MNLSRLLPFLSITLLFSAGSCFAQFGYVTQTPSAGAGVAQQAGYSADPYTVAGGGGVGYANQGYVTQQQGYATQGYVNQGYANQGYTSAFGAPAAAAGGMLTYGQLEIEYAYNTFKDKTVDPSSGIGLGLMAQLFNPFFLHGKFNWASTTSSGSSKNSYDFSTVSIGGGVYFPITPQIHLVGEVGGLYSSLSANKSSLSFSDGAFYVNPYLRIAASELLELDVGVLMTSANNYNARVLELGGYYKMFSSMDMGLGADFGDQGNTYHLGVRFRW